MAASEMRAAVHESPVTQRGFIMIPNVVVLMSGLNSNDKLIYGYLKHIAWRQETEEAEGALDTIANDLGLGMSTVQRSIKALVQSNLVISKRRGLGMPNLYIVRDPDMSHLTELSGQIDHSGETDLTTPLLVKSKSKKDLPTVGLEPVVKSDVSKPKKAKAPNVLFDALAEATEADPDSEGPRIAAGLNGARGSKGIRFFVEREFGPRPPSETDTDQDSEWNQAFRAEVFRRADLYRQRWPNVDITPTALRQNWHRVAHPLQRVGNGLTPEQIMQWEDR